MSTFGYVYSFGVYQDIYTRAGAGSAQRISWVGSTQLFFIAVTALPAGKLLDAGYFKHCIAAGIIVMSFS
jgi:hypothetical protein